MGSVKIEPLTFPTAFPAQKVIGLTVLMPGSTLAVVL